MDRKMTTSEPPVLVDVDEAKKKSGLPDLTTLAGAHEQIANLEIAVEHRTVIGQAIGILQERYDLDAEQAFAVLQRRSQDENIKLYVLATALADRRRDAT